MTRLLYVLIFIAVTSFFVAKENWAPLITMAAIFAGGLIWEFIRNLKTEPTRPATRRRRTH